MNDAIVVKPGASRSGGVGRHSSQTVITVTINCYLEGNDDESLFTDRAEIVDPRGRVLIVNPRGRVLIVDRS